MTAAVSSSLFSYLNKHLPRLTDCEGWVLPAGCLFYSVHLLLLLLLQLVQRTSLYKRLPLLQRGAWPRHGLNRLCCILHSSVAVFWICFILYVEGALWRGPQDDPYFGGSVTELQRPLLLYSVSFFVYDVTYVLIERDIPSSLHHLAALGALLYVLIQDKAGGELLAGLAVGECSTPLLHLRYFVRHYATVAAEQKALMETEKKEESQKREKEALLLPYPIPSTLCGFSFERLNVAAETAFVCLFGIARAVANPWVTLSTVTTRGTPLLVKLFASIICIISFYWLLQIAYLIYNRGTAGRARRKREE